MNDEEVKKVIREQFPTAPIDTHVDEYQFSVTIMTGNTSEEIEERKEALADILRDVGCRVDHFCDFLPAGGSIHTTAYVHAEEYLREQDAQKHEDAMYEAEIAAEEVMDNR